MTATACLTLKAGVLRSSLSIRQPLVTHAFQADPLMIQRHTASSWQKNHSRACCSGQKQISRLAGRTDGGQPTLAERNTHQRRCRPTIASRCLRWVLGLSVLFSAAARGSGTTRPNIVFIMADDLGYKHLGCYSQQKIRTPHLDRMAAEGMRFTDMYSGCCVCAPSRSVLVTGRHGGHTAVRGNIGGFPLAPEDITIAEAQHPRVVAELNQRLNDSREKPRPQTEPPRPPGRPFQ